MSGIDLSGDGGVVKEIKREGEGPQPQAGDEIRAHYVGTLQSNGQQFDSSRSRGRPFTFTLGQGQVIKGWDVGFASMRKGETCVLLLDSKYAYGSSGAGGVIPPNAALAFECELIDFGPAPPSSGCVVA